MDRLTIKGTDYRVECNFNAVMDFMDQTGKKDLSFLSTELSMQDWLIMMTACINEGERLEGHSHSFKPSDFGEEGIVAVSEMLQKFIHIFSRQNASEPTAAEPKKD